MAQLDNSNSAFEVTPQEWDSYFNPDEQIIVDTSAQAPTASAPAIAPTTEAAADGVVMFSEWLRKNYPEIYENVIITMPEAFIPEFALSGFRMSGVGIVEGEPVTDWAKSISDTIASLLPTYAQYRLQKDLINLNIKRAEQGLPPVSSMDMAPQVNVGVSSNVENIAKVAVFGVLGLGLLSILSKNK